MHGFKIDESMVGWHRLYNEGFCLTKMPFRFDITWGPENIKKFLDIQSDSFMRAPLEGYVEAPGIIDKARCFGNIKLDYANGKIEYDFKFKEEHDGWIMQYHYHGEKTGIKPWNLPWTHTTCYGAVTSFGRLISTGVTYFELKSIPTFIRSLRPI